MFIHLFVGEIDLGTVRDDERELHSFLARPPRLKKDAVNAGENQFAHRAPICGRLRFEPAVERRGDIDRSANALLRHIGLLSHMCHKYGTKPFFVLPRL